MIAAHAIPGLPEITAADDLAQIIAEGCARGGDGLEPPLRPGDVVVLAHKSVSKAEGRVRRLSDVSPTARAVALAADVEKDPRLVQVVLDESVRVVRATRGVLIVETPHGFVCANAGVDGSNVSADDDELVLLLPADPDRSARALRARLRTLTGVAPGVVITDSFGRAWRTGQCDVAIGVAGVRPVEDWRGARDHNGRDLRATLIAVADQLAAVADLARRKNSREPAVIVRGAQRHVTAADGPGVGPLIRAAEHDLFR